MDILAGAIGLVEIAASIASGPVVGKGAIAAIGVAGAPVAVGAAAVVGTFFAIKGAIALVDAISDAAKKPGKSPKSSPTPTPRPTRKQTYSYTEKSSEEAMENDGSPGGQPPRRNNNNNNHYDDKNKTHLDLILELLEAIITIATRGTRSVPFHITSRLMNYIRLGGVAQRIFEQTGILQEAVFRAGRSLTQDINCCIPGHHAAHVVRAQFTNDPRIQEFVGILETILGHTQNVPKYVNQWGENRVGKSIDMIQGDFLQTLASIDFRGELTTAVRESLNRLRELFESAITLDIENVAHSQEEIDELTKALEAIRNLTDEEMFDMGKQGLTFVQELLERMGLI